MTSTGVGNSWGRLASRAEISQISRKSRIETMRKGRVTSPLNILEVYQLIDESIEIRDIA